MTKCNWTFCSSPMGVQGGYWWQTSCGHRASGVRQLPHRCDYCGHLVTGIDSRSKAQTASILGGSPALPTGEMNGGAMCQQRQPPDVPNKSSNEVTRVGLIRALTKACALLRRWRAREADAKFPDGGDGRLFSETGMFAGPVEAALGIIDVKSDGYKLSAGLTAPGQDESHAVALRRLEELMVADPVLNTPEGRELNVLAGIVEAYEKLRWPITVADRASAHETRVNVEHELELAAFELKLGLTYDPFSSRPRSLFILDAIDLLKQQARGAAVVVR